jgi:hypothetical protein
MVYGDFENSEKVSIPRETMWVPKGTPMVPSEPQNLDPKLSKSLFNNPPEVNKPVAFDAQKQPST